MSTWKNIGAVAALSITASLAGTGCLAQSASDDTTEPEIVTASADQQIVAADQATEEKTGEANQAWWGGFGFPFWGGFGGFGGLGCGCGLGGFGLGGFGFPFWGGFGGLGCGFGGFGGFGGCGGCW